MKNQIGMNMLLWAAETRGSHIPIFKKLAAAGFDGVEISVVGQTTAELREMRGAVEDLSMSLTTSTFIPAEANPISSDFAIRTAAVDLLKSRIDRAETLGSSLLVGGLYQAHKVFSGRGPSQEEWAWSRDYLREVGTYAATAGIRLGLEFLNRFEAYLINTAEAAAKMCAEVGLDNVGVLYDTHHANIEEPDPSSALPATGKHLFHVHLSESHRGTLGTGQVKWAETFRALRAMDYRGWLTIEAFGTEDAEIAQAANVWRNAFESSEQLYRDGIAFIRTELEE
jgi:D-psicose/D-tagatose/L-ribulose 3-epimerase